MERIEPIESLRYIPHPLVVVTAGLYDDPRQRSAMTAAWVTRVSWDPPLVAVSFGFTRFTLELVRRFHEFAINVVDERLLKPALELFGKLSGRDVDKFKIAGVRFGRGRRIRAPVLLDAAQVMECVVEREVEAGDHVVVIGRVIEAYGYADRCGLVYRLGEAYRLARL